jgi:glycine C-acetyltransferase
VLGRVDIYTSTLGKALGGASGGFTSGRKEIIAWLRQKSRPYLFSNSLAPMIAAVSIAVLDWLQAHAAVRERLLADARYLRDGLRQAGFAVAEGEHPIIPVMVGEAERAQAFASRLFELGIYVVGFSFPVVPKGQARIRIQVSAAHQRADLDRAIAAFAQAGAELGFIA